MTEHHRRETDMSRTEIDALIAAENDPQKRVQLMVLQSIHMSLVANTDLTRELATELQSHKTAFTKHVVAFTEHHQREEAMINKGKGAWMVTVWVLGIIQLVGIGLWNETRVNTSKFELAMNDNRLGIARVEVRVTQLEKDRSTP
jgi:hypothetical protein